MTLTEALYQTTIIHQIGLSACLFFGAYFVLWGTSYLATENDRWSQKQLCRPRSAQISIMERNKELERWRKLDKRRSRFALISGIALLGLSIPLLGSALTLSRSSIFGWTMGLLMVWVASFLFAALLFGVIEGFRSSFDTSRRNGKSVARSVLQGIVGVVAWLIGFVVFIYAVS